MGSSIQFARRDYRAPWVVLCFVVAQAAFAAEPLLDEQDVDTQAVISALTPEKVSNLGITRGIMRKDPGAADSGMVPTAQPSLSLLITFSSNSATLTEHARAALDKVASALKSEQLSGYKFRIEGHADPRGSADANIKLSGARAASVVRYLTRADGVAPDRLVAIGKGSSELLNTQDPSAPENRRVTVVRLSD